MNNKTGPDILGVCEVENLVVLKRLVESLAPTGRKYEIVHHDMSDDQCHKKTVYSFPVKRLYEQRL